jgi:hypothetical protein
MPKRLECRAGWGTEVEVAGVSRWSECRDGWSIEVAEVLRGLEC